MKDESDLCLTLSGKTMCDTYCNDTLSKCNTYSPSPGSAYFVCVVNTKQVGLTRMKVSNWTIASVPIKKKNHFVRISEQ